MNRTVLAVGILFLFIVSSIIPMVIGNTINDKIKDEYFEKLTYVCYDEYENINFENYREINKGEIIENSKSYETPISKKSTDILPLDGPMDSPWPMKCHDSRHTSLSQYTTSNNPLINIWEFECNLIDGGIVIDINDTIYFGDFDNNLYAIHSNGTLKWTCDLGPFGWVKSCPAIAENGTIYVTSYDDKLHAIYPNGTKKWSFTAGDSITSSPIIGENGTIYFGTMGPGNYGRVFAVNPDGSEKWHYDTGYWITSDPAIGEDNIIYIGSGDNYLYALYPDGSLFWRFETGGYVKGPPSIAQDMTIYIGSWDGYLYAIYPGGTERWRCSIGGGTETNPSIGPDGTIYCGYDALYAIYPNNGSIKWTFNLGNDRYIHQSSPAISADGKIYVGINIETEEGGELLVVNPDGTENWRSDILSNDYVDGSPTIAEDGSIYIGTEANDMGYPYGVLYSFNNDELRAEAHGPYHGLINEPVQFTGSANAGHPPYSYHWDFGDGNTSEDQNPTHEYASASNYTVTLTVTDDNDSVAIDTTWALIRESNDPPYTPSIEGETHGYCGESYDYRFIATDLDGDAIWYFIEWGDESTSGWVGPYESNEEITKSHTWDDEGTYTIRAKAKDIFDAEGEWGTLEVTMPVNQQNNHPIVDWLLERFPNAFPILRYILEI